jgi:hypothetical protein
MTRKDYTALAADLNFILNGIKAEGNFVDTTAAENTFRITVFAVMEAMHRENGRFDRDRFMAAVGL